MERKTRSQATLLVAGLVLFGVSIGTWAGNAAAARARDPYASLDLFSRALVTIEQDYVEPIPTEELVDAAIDGMVDRLDPHSRWMGGKAVRNLRRHTESRENTIGVEVARTASGLVVTAVVPGSPASRDGVKVGDRLVSIDGETLERLSLTDVREKMNGDRGANATLTVARGETQVSIETTHDEVHFPAVEAARLGDLAYIRVRGFQRYAAEEVASALKRLHTRRSPAQGVVLDLRDNTGGLLEEAVGVVDLFVDDGPIVTLKDRRGEIERHLATSGGLGEDLPLLVLVNGMSASASEIVAGALQETGRARLVGTRTYGKGSVQQLYRNPDDTALKLTVAQYFLPSGEPVAPREGRKPDVEVPWTEAADPKGDLRRAIATMAREPEERARLLNMLETLESPPPEAPALPWSTPISERASVDPQLSRALELLTPG